ncbi:hypothetical protein NWP17_12015, partial [Chrysosporum bergii ANA360D]
GEIHGIGFDMNNDHNNPQNFFQLSGTQNWGQKNYKNYTTGHGWKAYTINVGDYFTGNFNYLTLVNDHDVANPTANSQFRHLKIYQADNIIKGTNGDDTLIGTNGKDILLGRGRNDVFVYENLTNSLLNKFDVITDFNANQDSFAVSNAATEFNNVGSPATFDTAAISAILTNLSAHAVVQFTFGSRTFVAINDGVAGFNANTDAVMEVTGLTGTLTTANFTV